MFPNEQSLFIPTHVINQYLKVRILPQWGTNPFLTLLMSRVKPNCSGVQYNWKAPGRDCYAAVAWRHVLRPLDSYKPDDDAVAYFRHIEGEVASRAEGFKKEVRCAFWEAVAAVYQPRYAGVSHETWKPQRTAWSEDAVMRAAKDLLCPVILTPMGWMNESWEAASKFGGLAIATATPDCVLVFPLHSLVWALMTSAPVVVDQDKDVRPTDKAPAALAMYYAFVFEEISQVTKLTF